MENTIKIRKGNVILRVSEEELKRYEQNGFVRVELYGKAEQTPTTEDMKSLERKLMKASEEIKSLKKALSETGSPVDVSEYETELEVLRDKNRDLHEQLKDTKKQLKQAEKRLRQYEE